MFSHFELFENRFYKGILKTISHLTMFGRSIFTSLVLTQSAEKYIVPERGSNSGPSDYKPTTLSITPEQSNSYEISGRKKVFQESTKQKCPKILLIQSKKAKI